MSLELIGRVEAVAISPSEGDVNSETYGFGSLATKTVPKIQLVRGYGIKGDRHAGTRLLDVREKELRAFGLPVGIEIANYREFSAVSLEELEDIEKSLDLPKFIPVGSLGENLVLSGIPKLSQLPIGTMLFFKKSEKQIRTAVLVVWAQNKPCAGPGEVLQKIFPSVPNLKTLFAKHAIGKRGVVGSIYSSGVIHEGDIVIAKIPEQKIYQP